LARRVFERKYAMKLSMLGFALEALMRRKARAFALGGGLAFAVALLAAVLFLTESLRAEAERAHAAHPDIVVQTLIGGRPSVVVLGLGETERGIRDIPSVRSVVPRIWGYVFLPAISGNLTIIGTPSGERSLSVANGVLAEGRDVIEGAHEMVLGTELARLLGMQVGDELALPTANADTHSLKLVGTFRSSLDMYTADVLVCDDSDARVLLNIPSLVATDLAVTLWNKAESHVVARTIAERMPGARVLERDALLRVYQLAYGRRAGFVLAASIPVFLAFFVLAWDRASGIGSDERKEIAILKAIGWSTTEVLWAKLFESLLVGASATAVGLLLGYAWIFWFGAPGLRPALAGWSALYPRAALTPAVDVAQLLGISLSVMGPFALLSIMPAWRAATTDPLESMRNA
jgi:ABC-type lipoprotein release transport system permease subunit